MKLPIKIIGISVIALSILTSVPLNGYADNVVAVQSQQKITQGEGGFTGILGDDDLFGESIEWLGNLGAGAPTPSAVAVGAIEGGNEDKGAVWILFLNSDGTVNTQQEISDGVGGLPNGVLTSTRFGAGVASLGDLDGDGVVDLAVGTTNPPSEGQVWILFLNSDGTVKQYQVIGHGLGGFPTGLLDSNDGFGVSLDSLGDLDGDGVVDLAVGAHGDDDGTGQPPNETQAGAVWILFLNTDGTVKSYQKISQTQGNGPSLADDNLFGKSLDNLGDLDSDGVVDIAVGAIFDGDGGVDRGAVWILFLNSDGTVKTHQKISDTQGNFTGVLDDHDQFGDAVASLGDLDGDGVIDFAVGANKDDDGGVNRGAVWLLYLNTDGTVKAHQKISSTQGGFVGPLNDDDRFGHSVNTLGDLNGDGTIDLAVGADLSFNNKGSVWVLFLNKFPIADAGPDQTVHVGTAVTLDGSGSHDPDENYPLTFSWEIVSYPGGSPPALSGADTANPTFTSDLVGDYVIQLIVTDSLGLSSEPNTVTVSTFNTAPTADAGSDQVIIEINSLVQLDGTESFDLDGDDFTYQWTMLTRPVDSVATLDDPASPTPTFVADVHGDYVIELLVTDSFDAVSDPDTVLVSFENVPPVADPGDNQAVLVGDTVFLDGSGSSDANLDTLTYSWAFVSVPDGSEAVLSDPTSSQTTFVTDVAGTYIVSLTVDDGFGGSDTANVTVVATSTLDELIQTLQDLIATINGFDPGVFKNRNMQNAMTNKINAVIAKVDQGLYQEALDKLENDILGKTDGCAANNIPDPNDWIRDCASQGLVYPLIIHGIDLLSGLV